MEFLHGNLAESLPIRQSREPTIATIEEEEEDVWDTHPEITPPPEGATPPKGTTPPEGTTPASSVIQASSTSRGMA